MMADRVQSQKGRRSSPLRDALEGREPDRTIYIVRHGKTKLNNQSDLSVDRERGWSNVPLTAEGRQEAQRAALKLKTKGIEAIVSSDLERAKQTAQIIGKVLGIKPEFSSKLRPWNLGDLTGKVMTEATPQIAAYAKKPDEVVPGGESFNTFCERAFQGFAECVGAHPDETLLVVCHHRVERLIEGWNELGQPADHAIDLDVFMSDGEPPGGIEELETTVAKLKGDGCSGAKGNEQWQSNGGTKVRQDAPTAAGSGSNSPPISRSDPSGAGSPSKPASSARSATMAQTDNLFDPNQMAGAPAPMNNMPVSSPMGMPPMGGPAMPKPPNPRQRFDQALESSRNKTAPAGMAHMAHGRAIAGAKALHAVGHITAQERDQHIQRSQSALRKPFGSFAP